MSEKFCSRCTKITEYHKLHGQTHVIITFSQVMVDIGYPTALQGNRYLSVPLQGLTQVGGIITNTGKCFLQIYIALRAKQKWKTAFIYH